MKVYFCLLLFLLYFSLAFSQSFDNKNGVDRVEALIQKGDSLKTQNKDKALVVYRKGLSIALDGKLYKQAGALYKKIGIVHHRDGNYAKAEHLYKQGIALDSVVSSTVRASLLYNMSLIKTKFNEQDSAFFYLNESLKHYEKIEFNNSVLKAFLRASVVYKDKQLYEKALTYAIKAYEGFKKYNNARQLAYACISIGNIQNQMGNYHQALEYHYQALELEIQLNDNLGKGISYTNIANAYDNLKKPDSAIANYTRALEFFDQKSTHYAITLNNLAITHKNTGHIDLAKTHFKKSIELNEFLKDTASLLYNYNGISGLYLERNDLRKAKYYLDKTYNLLPSETDKQILLSFYENQAEYYQKVNNYKSALNYRIKYSDLYKDIYNSEQAEIVQRLQTQFDFERKENEILKLNLANKDAQLLLSQKNKSIKIKNLTVIILGIIILLVIVVYYIFLQKQKGLIQSGKIEKLEAIYEGQEIIKKRIARDLHDIITTNFDGLRLKILALKRATKINEKVDGITEELKRMNQQIRTVSHRLYPLEMYMGKQKFNAIIKSRLSEFQLYGNVFVELENQLPEALNELPLAVQNNFYGILLEVLNNVEKHALATKIKIKNFKDNNNNLHFMFEDNGIGIENNHKEGIGLLNIKQRVEILEGACSISKTTSGTQVHINFPIHKAS